MARATSYKPYKPLVILATVILLAFGGSVRASREDYELAAQGIQLGTIPDFPYRQCNTSNGVYRLAPLWTPLGGGKYCFTIKVNQSASSCSGACCTADLHKIEFNISSSCLVAGSSVTATINGVPTRVSPSFDKPPPGPVGATALKITQLGLNTTTAQNAELCITLKPNRARQGCTTLEQLCSSPGLPAGTCTAATFDVECDCCPISQVVNAPPQAPPSPVVPGYRRCDMCVVTKLERPFVDVRPFRFNAATCNTIQQNISNIMNGILASNGIPAIAPFAPNATTCFETEILTCGIFNGTMDLRALNSSISEILPLMVEVSAGNGGSCRPQLEGYKVVVSTNENQCLDFSQSSSCFLPTTPFPNCSCNSTVGVLPFTISPAYYARNSTAFGSSVTEYCFTIDDLPPNVLLPSTCYNPNDLVAKIEFFANQTLKSAVKGFTITPTGGISKKVSPSWGGPQGDALKVTLNWMPAQAKGGVVCVAVQKPFTMASLCKGMLPGGQCFVSIFNRDSSSSDYCCPIFRTGP